MLNLGFFFALVLLGVLATAITTTLRPGQARLVALVGVALACFGWLVARAELPLSLTIGDDAAAWPAWTWQVGSPSWFVSLAVLLLALGALALRPRESPDKSRALEPVFLQLLAVVTLLACWAGSLATYVLAWTLLNGVWLVGMALSTRFQEEQRSSLTLRVGAGFGGIRLLWLASASGGSTTAGSGAAIAAVGSWPTLTRSLVLLAAAYQLGVFPFHYWHATSWLANSPDVPSAPVRRNDARTTFGVSRFAPARAALLHTAPAAAGALLLTRLENASDIGLAFALPLTLLGLLSLLLGARHAWSAAEDQPSLPAGLILAQAGVALLAGVWAGPQAALAETAVLVLGGGVLLLANGIRQHQSDRLPIQPGPIIAVAALAGLPLTAGFVGRGALYDAWLAEGRWLLVLATAILHVPLLLAALRAVWPTDLAADTGVRIGEAGRAQSALPRLLALLLPALGLLSVARLGQTSVLAWLAILLPIAVAVVLMPRLSGSAELRQMLQEALSVPLPARRPWHGLRRLGTAAATATREALAILEGEGGLLWLLIFVVVLYLAR